MTEQLSLIVLVLALATGLVTSVVATTHMQESRPVFFRYFLSNILLFNLLILAGLVARYLQLTLQVPELQGIEGVLPVLLIVMAALKLGWLYVFILMNKALPTDILPRQLPTTVARAAIVIFLVFGALMLAGWLRHLDSLLQYVNILFETIIIGSALIATIGLTCLPSVFDGGDPDGTDRWVGTARTPEGGTVNDKWRVSDSVQPVSTGLVTLVSASADSFRF
jgi:hypothetical protein